MRSFRVLAATLVLGSLAGIPAVSAQGPDSQGSETVARPRKKADTPPPPEEAPIPSKYNRKDHELDPTVPTYRSDVTTVQVYVSVLDNKGRFIPRIPKGNFRILEDNVPQQISSFSTGNDAPMTVALLVEFSNLFQQYWSQGWYETLTAAYGFVQTLKPEDYVAVIAYDLRPEILSDFTQDRMKTQEAMQRLRIAGFSESNLFDALVDTEQRMTDIEGRKAIVLIATGRDTFSKLTFDKTRKAVQEAAVPIYGISILQAYREMADARGAMGPISRMDFLQADNEMKTFSKETGGQAFFPRFIGEYPGIYRAISDALRNQYSLAYHPTNQARDGKYRKLKVELVNPQGEPLAIRDEKGKLIKYQVIAKSGYTAPRSVE